MLRVTVEVVPHGVEHGATALTVLYVGNDGTGTHGVGNYDVYEADPRGQPYPRDARTGWIGRIENFDRTGPEHGRNNLAAEALRVLLGREERVVELEAALAESQAARLELWRRIFCLGPGRVEQREDTR